MLNLMDNLYNKEFRKINTTDRDYPQKLQQHTQEKEKNNKLKDLIMNLTYSMRTPNEHTLSITNQLKSLLNQEISMTENGTPTGIPTGAAANIEEKNEYKVDDPLAQKIYLKIIDIYERLKNLNSKIIDLLESNKKIEKSEIIKILEELKQILEEIKKYYEFAKNRDNILLSDFELKSKTLIYQFNKVLDILPEIFNNLKRLINKYKYYNKNQKEDIEKLEEYIKEIEKILPKTITSNISLVKKAFAEIIYLINRIIDNIRYRIVELEEDDVSDEIRAKYKKPEGMSKENEAIFEYNLKNPYNPDNIDELKKFLMRDDVEGYRDTAYKDINGVLTIGYGDTHGVKAGMKTNRIEAEKKLEENIRLASTPIVN